MGNRDNQIMSGAILSPARLVIRKVTVGGDATFDYAATGGICERLLDRDVGRSRPDERSPTLGRHVHGHRVGAAGGLAFTSLVCVDEDYGSSVDLNLRQATIDLDPGETVTCTYTNTKQARSSSRSRRSPTAITQSFLVHAELRRGGFPALRRPAERVRGPRAGHVLGRETVPSGWSF